MDRVHGHVYIDDVTLRDAIDGLLANPDSGVDPSSALAEAGFDDVPADLFGTALSHFADAAPLATADALAPVVTRVGPVPFEAGDLPETDLDPQLDAFGMFAEVSPDPSAFAPSESETPQDHEPNAAVDAATAGIDHDPSDLDIDGAQILADGPAADEGTHFGAGEEVDDFTLDDEIDEFDVPQMPEAAAFNPEPEFDDGFDQLESGDDLLEEGGDLFSVDFEDDADGADPLDLDFEG